MKFIVTAEDWDKAQEFRRASMAGVHVPDIGKRCPVALALQRVTGETWNANRGFVRRQDAIQPIPLPAHVGALVETFDQRGMFDAALAFQPAPTNMIPMAFDLPLSVGDRERYFLARCKAVALAPIKASIVKLSCLSVRPERCMAVAAEPVEAE